LLGVLVGDDRFELVGEPAQGGAVGQRVRLCGEAGGEVGFSLAEGFEAVAVATDAGLEEVGREPSLFEALEVAFQLALDACDLGARRRELLLQFGAVRSRSSPRGSRALAREIAADLS
jgi:hypothetical protein